MAECNCEEWIHVMRYKPVIEELDKPVFAINNGKIKHIRKETHLDCKYRALLVCANCHAEQEIIRQGKHFEDDLNFLLEIVGFSYYSSSFDFSSHHSFSCTL